MPHLNKPPPPPTPNPHQMVAASLFENPRARELRELSKKAAKRVVESYRIGCINRSLRCCCRLLFSLTGVKKKLSPVQEEEEEEERETHTHTQKTIECIYTGASNIGVERETHL